MTDETGGAIKVARGGVVVVAGQLARVLIQFASVVLLSRLLLPSDFGLVAMVIVFVAFGELLRDFGMSTASLQARQLSNQQASNVFWVNTTLGAAAAVTLTLLTPIIALLYGEPRLSEITPILAVTLLLNGVQSQVQVQLARSMRFKAIALTETLAQLAGLAVGVVGALLSWGYWALVAQLVSASAILLVTRLAAARWIPTLPRRGHGSSGILRSGGSFGLAQLLTVLAANVGTLVIGSRFGASATGYYNRAFQFLTLPVASLLGPLTQVVVPAMNSGISRGWRADEILLRIQFGIGVIVVWIFVVTAVTAEWLIPSLLGAEWEPSVVLFQILALGGAFQVFSFVSYWGFIVEQLSRQLLYYNIVTKTLAVILVISGSLFGLEGVAWGYSIGLVVSWPINLIWLKRAANHQALRFFRNGLYIIVAAAMAFLLGRLALDAIVEVNPWLMITAGVAASSVIYIGILVSITNSRKEMLAAGKFTRNILDLRKS